MKNPEADVHIGLFAREMLLKFARQEPGNVQQVINTLESTRMTMMDNGFASNPIDLKDKSGNKIFSIVVGHKNKITLSIQPDGPVRYGEEQIWFEKNLIPEAIWIQIEAESKKAQKPSVFAPWIGIDLDVYVEEPAAMKPEITNLGISKGSEFLVIWMNPKTTPYQNVMAELEEIKSA